MSLKGRYKITELQYAKMFGDQNGLCAICGEMPSPKLMHGRLAIDHDHNTGQIRGLLCITCNTGLGGLKDNILLINRASAYLEKHEQLDVSATYIHDKRRRENKVRELYLGNQGE